MKPHIALLVVWYDCGWRYERWYCKGLGIFAEGESPKHAYSAWREAFL